MAASKGLSMSRSGTPGPGLARGSAAQLMVPLMHPSQSLSSLRVHSYHDSSQGTSTNAPMDMSYSSSPPRDHLDSSASSVINMDVAEGLLLQEIDAESTDMEDLETLDKSGLISRDEQKQALRDQLKKSLNQQVLTESEHARHSHGLRTVSPELKFEQASLFLPREYFILTAAGKPVFISRPGSGDEDGMASTIGIMQALISVFLDDNDKLRSINAGRTRITFLLRPPLYYVCASSWGEPESVTRLHLEYLHLQILSIVSGSQLKRLFERRTNFDLRRLLDGAETFMSSLLLKLDSDISMNLSSLHCLKVEPTIRKRTADLLTPKLKDMLYVLLVMSGRVVMLIRPRRHSIHPADIHIIMNTIHSPSIFNSPASASWLPICLPKFNPSGFVNMYVTFLRKDEPLPGTSLPGDNVEFPQDNMANQEGLNESGIALVCVSAGGDFETIRAWCNSVIHKMTSDKTLSSLVEAHNARKTEYSVSELGIPGLRHFVYKSRTQVQITLPIFEDPYHQATDRNRIITIYQVLHDSIHAKSGQDEGLKLQYLRTETESVMGWITQPFEVYIALSPLLPKSAAVGAANAVARWVKKEEVRLFLKDAPVF